MTAMSNYLENLVLENVLNNGTNPASTNVYLSLHTGDPLDDDSGANEVSTSGTAYARVIQTGGFSVSGVATRAGNTALATFAEATLDWGIITHVGIYDASTAGNLLFHGPLTANRTVDSGDTFSFAADALGVTFD